MQLSRIQDELESLKAELWEYVEDEETDLQTDIKETMNYLLDLVADLILCQEVRKKHNANINNTKKVTDITIDKFKKLIKEAVAEEFAKHSFTNPTYIPVQPYYCPNYYPTGPYCEKNITYTVDTKTTPKN